MIFIFSFPLVLVVVIDIYIYGGEGRKGGREEVATPVCAGTKCTAPWQL